MEIAVNDWLKASFSLVRLGKVCGIATWLGRYGVTSHGWNHELPMVGTTDTLRAMCAYKYMSTTVPSETNFVLIAAIAFRLLIAISTSMFVLKSLSVAVAVCITAVAHPTSHVDFEKTVAEKLAVAPTGWVQDASEKVDKDATSITLKIHLVNKDMDKFHEHAMNVSTWSNRRYIELELIP
jgi:hypothetical protein